MHRDDGGDVRRLSDWEGLPAAARMGRVISDALTTVSNDSVGAANCVLPPILWEPEFGIESSS